MNRHLVTITGGSGYIGTNLTLHLLRKGYLVVNIDKKYPKEFIKLLSKEGFKCKLISDYDEDIVEKVDYWFAEEDLTKPVDNYELECLLMDTPTRPSSLVHLASHKDVIESIQSPGKYINNNLRCTINALRFAEEMGMEKIIHASSSAVYEDVEGECFESHLGNEHINSPYSLIKSVEESMVDEFSDDSVSLRFANPVGGLHRSLVDKSDSMMGNILKSISTGDPFIIYGNDFDTEDHTAERDFLDIRDLVETIELSLNHFYGTVNVGSGINTSILSACKQVKELYPNFEYKIGDRRPGDAEKSSSFMNLDKMKEHRKPKYTFSDTLKFLVSL